MNKKKLLMPKNERYPINQSAVNEWVTTLKATSAPTEVVDFANFVGKNLRYISFDEFYEELLKGARNVAFNCKYEKAKLVLLIPGEKQKSNFWVNLLIWPIIAEYVVGIKYESKRFDWQSIEATNVIVVYADDAAFTGTQAREYIAEEINRGFFNQRTISKIFYLIPFMSGDAQDILKEVTEELFERDSDATQIQSKFFTSDTSLVPWFDLEDAPELYKLRQYPGFVNLNDRQCLVYFDHKLPDTLSVPDFILLFAPTYIANEKRFQTRSLITNCTVTIKEDSRPAVAIGRDQTISYLLEHKLPEGELMGRARISICPPRFTASIVYDEN